VGDNHLVVNFPALHQASADIQKALNALEAQLAQLERAAAPLVATWEGDARQGYDARQAQWRRASGDLATMLRDIKIAVDASAADYWSTEQQAIGRF
jgi:early secretory antigenic target protein ESAT-6